MTPPPALSVVIVNYNGLRHLGMCLRSLYGAGLRVPCEYILVDNHSTDGSVEMVRERYPLVRLIANQHNRGFAAATNQGIRAARGRYVLLLNCDTVVNGPSLQALIDFMDAHPGADAAGGKLLNPDGSFQGGWAAFSTLGQEFLIASRLGALVFPGYPSHRRSGRIRAVDWLSAACLLVRRDAFDKVGCLDEEYVMYSEEVDWQFRLRQTGGKVYYLPQVSTLHHGGASQDRWPRRKMVYRGKILFYRKNYGRVRELALRMLLASITCSKFGLWMLLRLLRGGSSRAAGELRSNREVLELCFKP